MSVSPLAQHDGDGDRNRDAALPEPSPPGEPLASCPSAECARPRRKCIGGIQGARQCPITPANRRPSVDAEFGGDDRQRRGARAHFLMRRDRCRRARLPVGGRKWSERTDCDDPSDVDPRCHGEPARVVRRRGNRIRRGAGPRPERAGLRPQHADQPDPGRGRLGGEPAGLQPVRDAALCAAVQARHLRVQHRTAQLPGRLLHRRRRPRPVPERRRHQRLGLRPQPVRRRQLHRAQQLLALALEPDHQRDHPGLRLLQRRVLGRVAGGADAPGPRQRAHDPDGLLHRPVVRERRVHRQFGVRRQHRDQRLAAAVARRNSALDGWTNGVWNQVFSGVVGAPAQCFPAQASCGGPYTTLASSPVTREAPYLYVDDAGQLQGLRPGSAARRRRARRGGAGRRPARPSRSTTSSSPGPRTTRRRSTTRCPRAGTCSSRPACTSSTGRSR